MMKKPADPERQAQLRAELERDRAQRQAGYRERALKILPHVCARCAREFAGKRLRELTVHHKDHNYKNNPPDGSNWELLCIYCHDDEHEKSRKAGHGGGGPDSDGGIPLGGFQAFDGLDRLLNIQPGQKEENR